MSDNMFRIFYDGKWIGSSDLEQGDPPMGVAHGRFFPEPSYFDFQPVFQNLWEETQDHLNISVLQPSGDALGAKATRIDDHPELGNSDIEVCVIGIEADLYQKLFPGLLDLYNSSCKN